MIDGKTINIHVSLVIHGMPAKFGIAGVRVTVGVGREGRVSGCRGVKKDLELMWELMWEVMWGYFGSTRIFSLDVGKMTSQNNLNVGLILPSF